MLLAQQCAGIGFRELRVSRHGGSYSPSPLNLQPKTQNPSRKPQKTTPEARSFRVSHLLSSELLHPRSDSRDPGSGLGVFAELCRPND